MIARLTACALVFAMAGAPLATEACEATCAARDAQAPASNHSCHQQAASRGATIAAVHACGHEDGTPTALERVHHTVIAPGVASTVTLPTQTSRTSHIRTAAFDSSPPSPLNLISQLRV